MFQTFKHIDLLNNVREPPGSFFVGGKRERQRYQGTRQGREGTGEGNEEDPETHGVEG